MKIEISDFRGIAPKADPRALPNNAAVTAKNVRIESGVLESWNKSLDQNSTLKTGVIKSLFLYERTHWFNWTQEVSAVASPSAQDPWARVYFTGDGAPKVTNNTIATGGASLPAAAYDCGIPAPVDAITAVVTDSGADPDNFSDDETIYYWYTLANEQGDEGPYGPPSSPVEKLAPGDTVTLNVPTPAVNTQNINQKIIYRGASAGDTAYIQRVAIIPLATTEFVDNVPTDELGDVIESTNFFPPDSEMKGLTLGANGIMGGFAGNEVMFSEAYLPHAWPFSYRSSIKENIVAMTATSSGFVVVTDGAPFLFSGVSPDGMTGMKLNKMQACVSSRSLVDFGSGAIYASPDGLVMVGESSVDVITNDILSKRTWKRFKPETIHAYRYEEQYIAFYGDDSGNGDGIGGFVFDLRTGDFTELDFYATAGFSDIYTDTLYLVFRSNGVNSLHAWDSSERKERYQWRSKIFKMHDTSFSCCRVHSVDPSKVGIKVFADGACIFSQRSLQDEIFRLPTARGKEWQVELTGSAPVQKVVLAHGVSELA